MVSVNWRLAAVTVAGVVLVFSTGVALDFVGSPQAVSALAPVAVGIAAGYAIYRRFNDDDSLTDVLN
jgi:hypothetical protein